MRIVGFSECPELAAKVHRKLRRGGLMGPTPQPTHALLVVSRGGRVGRIGGVVSLQGCVAFVWFDRKWESKLGRWRAMQQIEARLRGEGHAEIVLILHVGSPLYPFAERAGYLPLAAVELFHKPI